MDTRASALARSHAYHLLGKLILRGVSADTLDHVCAIEPLAEQLASFVDTKNQRFDEVAVDEAAAAHHDLFGFNVFAFQSTFLEPSARVGGHHTERVADAYHKAGFPVAETAESADHLGVELNFLGFLSRMEAEADGEQADAARELCRRFLDDNLLRWLPAVADAICLQGHPFYVAVADLIVELICEHRAALDESGEFDFALPEPPTLLEDRRSGLRDVAQFLLIPAHTGMYVSRDVIRTLSISGQLPAGFGSRRIMLTNVLRSAANYDGLEHVVGGLRAHVEHTRKMWESFADGCVAPAAQIAEVWHERLDHTDAILEEIAEAVAALEE